MYMCVYVYIYIYTLNLQHAHKYIRQGAGDGELVVAAEGGLLNQGRRTIHRSIKYGTSNIIVGKNNI